MSDSQLTPRVGDRVLVSGGTCDFGFSDCPDFPSTTGYVADIADSKPTYSVHLDRPSHLAAVLPGRVQVLDRKAVEWPEGWRLSISSKGDWMFLYIEDEWYASCRKGALDKIIADGPYILEHWDELTGGEQATDTPPRKDFD